MDVESLKTERKEAQSEIDKLSIMLATKVQIEKADLRIKELEEEESELSQKIMDVERELDTIKEFELTKSRLTEEGVNKRFKHVRFRMFDTLNDGTINPACVCTYKGVPYPSVNTAGQIKAGLEIIEVMCDHYGVSAPIFVDGGESITDIPKTKSQQIRLIVQKGVSPFKVE